MIIRKRSPEQIETDAKQLREVLEQAFATATKKNSAATGYGGSWAQADLRVRFTDIARKFVRLLPQVWDRAPELGYDFEDIEETGLDLLVYSAYLVMEARRLKTGFYQAVEDLPEQLLALLPGAGVRAKDALPLSAKPFHERCNHESPGQCSACTPICPELPPRVSSPFAWPSCTHDTVVSGCSSCVNRAEVAHATAHCAHVTFDPNCLECHKRNATVPLVVQR